MMIRIRFCAGLIALFLLFGSTADAQDGAALIRKMQAVYTSLRSYSQKSSATETSAFERETRVAGQSAELRYQAPNRMYIFASSPQVGSVVAFSNGQEQTVYRSSVRAYIKRPAPPTGNAFVRSLAEFGVGAMLDPLYFLVGESPDQFVANYSTRGMEAVNGISCNVVVGTLKASAIGRAKSGRVTFWIDRKADILRKVQLDLIGIPQRIQMEGVVNGKKAPKTRSIIVNKTITQFVQEARLNPALEASAFTYAIPKNATQQNPDRFNKR